MENMEKIFNEFSNHLMKDEKPSKYFNEIMENKKVFQVYPLKLLFDLTNIDQSTKYHPEGSVWNHTMMVIDRAAERKNLSNDPMVFMWAALLHDLGKITATKVRKGRITSYDHDKYGKELSIKFLSEINNNEDFIRKVSALVRWHMQPLFVIKNLPFSDINRMSKETSIYEVYLLGICDRIGRGGLTLDKIEEEKNNMKHFLDKCNKYLMCSQ